MRPGPGRQHADAVGDEHRLGDRVGDEQHGRRQLLAQPGEEVAHVGPGDLVEGGERLVHQQQRRAEGHRPHQRDALLHPARQLVRVGVGEVLEAHVGEQLGRGRAAHRRAATVDVEEQPGVGGDGAPGQQGRRLRDEADALARSGVVRAGAVDRDVTRRRLVEPADEPQQGRLAAAAGAEHGDDLPGLDREVDGVEGLAAHRTAW